MTSSRLLEEYSSKARRRLAAIVWWSGHYRDAVRRVLDGQGPATTLCFVKLSPREFIRRMGEQSTSSVEHAISFGPFRILPAQQVLLEGDAPVRLGSRALEILIALVERAGELVSKNELMARVWPNTVVEENNLKVHVATLRRVLGDGQPGRRYLATVPGRGYRFVAPVSLAKPRKPLAQPSAAPERAHNLPASQTRALGRGDTISALLDQLPRRRFITIVGAGGIGKTTVALAVAEALIAAYEHGIRFVDLAPLRDPHFVPGALASALGLAIQSDNAVPDLITYLQDKQMLLVLDSCEHVIEMAAALAERVLNGAAGVQILATSREPLRAKGERVHRLSPLELPPNSSGLTAAEALAFPSVQLFVERAAATLDGFELDDADAPIVADICRKLEGMPLAIELAASRTDAFGVRQLSALLNDRFRLLTHGRRAALPRHRTLIAALDWSYEFLPEDERILLRRLSVFAGAFTLDSARAVAADANFDVVEGVANLVAKSLVSADVMGPVVQIGCSIPRAPTRCRS
jgi:predicted ATPase/DNA-binding winged helix-turn-helix (wHTH) protein